MPTLTTTGSPTANGDSTVTINSTGSDRVQAPVALIDETQGWFAIRTNESALDTLRHYAFGFGLTDETNLVRLYRGTTAQGGKWRMSRIASSSGVEAVIPVGVTQDTDCTIIGKWTATQVGISANGAAFTLAGNVTIPVLAATLFDIGQLAANHWLVKPLYWCAAGTGTLSDAQAAALHAFGNIDPTWADLPPGSTPTFLWTADDFTYQDAAVATAPTAPQSLAAVAGDAQVALSWSAPVSDGGSAITGYKIYRGIAPGGEGLLASPAGTGTNYTDVTAANGTTYYYRVSAVNAIGETLSSEVSATPASPVVPGTIRTFKRFYGPALLGNAAATLYTCPPAATSVIRHIHVSNPSGAPVNFTFTVGSDTVGARLWDAEPIPANDFDDHIVEHILTAGEVIQGYAGSAATLNLTVDGYELTGTAPAGIVYPGAGVFPSDFPAYPNDDLFPH